MPKIVISYRRSSYDAIVGRIRDKLVSHYGDGAVYMDVDNIPYGIDFREHINAALKEGDVLVAVIGPKWLGAIRGRKARIFDETDPVRVEIETALNRGITVVPILVDGTKMPKPTDVPESIAKLCYHNAAIVDAGRDFHQHMDRLIRSMEIVLKRSQTPAPPEQSDVPQRKLLTRRTAVIASAVACVVLFAAGILTMQPLFHEWFAKPTASETRAIERAPQATVQTDPPRSDPVTAVAASMGKRVALVIGNSAYRNVPTLTNTVHDAVAISDLLRTLGFSVNTRSNLANKEFANALAAFQDEAKKADIAAIFYAGHALEISGTNYIIPVDATLARESDLAAHAIRFDSFLSAIAEAGTLRLLFLDACRDNPFLSRAPPGMESRGMTIANIPTRGISVGLSEVELKMANTLIAYAAKSGSVAMDGEGVHSPFTAALLKHLGTPNLDIRIVMGKVRDEVLRATRGMQEPYIYQSLGGDVFALAARK